MLSSLHTVSPSLVARRLAPVARAPCAAPLRSCRRPPRALHALRCAGAVSVRPGTPLTAAYISFRAHADGALLQAPDLPYRVGHGFDLHRLAPGLKLILGGVDVPSEKGCEAHSDGARSLYLLTRTTASLTAFTSRRRRADPLHRGRHPGRAGLA